MEIKGHHIRQAHAPIGQWRIGWDLQHHPRQAQYRQVLGEHRRIIGQAEGNHRTLACQQLAPPEPGLDAHRRHVAKLIAPARGILRQQPMMESGPKRVLGGPN